MSIAARFSILTRLARQGLSEAKSNLDDGNLRCVKKPLGVTTCSDLKRWQRSRARHARCNRSGVFPHTRRPRSPTGRKTCARKIWSWERRGICYDSCVVSALHTQRFFSEESAVCCEKRRCNLYRLCTDEEKITYFQRLCRASRTQAVPSKLYLGEAASMSIAARFSILTRLARQGLSEAKSNLDDGNLRCVKKPLGVRPEKIATKLRKTCKTQQKRCLPAHSAPEESDGPKKPAPARWSWERRGICYDSCVVSALHTLRFFSEESAVCCEKRRCNLHRLCTDEEKITYFQRLCRASRTQAVPSQAVP